MYPYDGADENIRGSIADFKEAISRNRGIDATDDAGAYIVLVIVGGECQCASC